MNIDDLLGACVVGWIAGVTSASLGSFVTEIFYGFQSYFDVIDAIFEFPVFVVILAITIAIIVSSTFIWLLQSLSILNGLLTAVVGMLVVSPMILALGFFPFGALVVFVGICTALAGWHAGASFTNDAG